MMNTKMIDEKELKNVVGGITREQFYASEAITSKLCTTCGGIGTITLEDGSETDGRIYTIVRCSVCGGAWKTYLDTPSTQPVM
ncbi:MAG: hypothetical protein IJ736_15275 [Firmicutes bacterium]|nr:hypothetical protein [Bacillota bacterium]